MFQIQAERSNTGFRFPPKYADLVPFLRKIKSNPIKTVDMYGTIALKLIVGMLGVLFFLRVIGKAQMAQITPLDTVSAFVIGALVGGVIYNPDMHVVHLLFAILVWTSFNLLIRYSLRTRFFRRLFSGDSVYIVKGGVLNLRVFRRNGIEMEQFRTLLREKGVFSMFDVDDVRFETNGQFTVSIKGETSESHLLLNNGYILHQSLESIDKDDKWLMDGLKKYGYTDPGQLFCVEWTPARGFYIADKDGKVHYGTISKRAAKEVEISA